ncbi:unnamed protein product [Nippostrongylus brasiliensis]|uniref:Tyrosine-protein kinase STYK1 (inferred by orthology to a human protein) n=1 Tax=Nippostrongylus brasiliensis TaxID=27835 RepID=A0A158R2H3_NIPBR|nr:unnamed protein product [Nippostrongylus brasiliensis]
MPIDETIKYKFDFGINTSVSIETKSLWNEMETWIEDSAQMQKFWESSRTTSGAFQQSDDPQAPLSSVIKSFSDIIANDNQQSSTVAMKKQVVLLTDYIPLNVTDAMNRITKVNVQKLGVFHEMNLTDVAKFVSFPVYSAADDILLNKVRQDFQRPLDFEFPTTVYQGKPVDRVSLFMMGFDAGTIHQTLSNSADGDLCSVPSNKMLDQLLKVRFAHNDTIRVGGSSGDQCDQTVQKLLEVFVSNAQETNEFTSLLVTNTECAASKVANYSGAVSGKAWVRLILSQDLSEAYTDLIAPLADQGFLNSTVNRQVVLNTAFYLQNYSTSCTSEMPLVPLVNARPYHRPKHLYIALDDMVWITACATISVSVVGVLIYQHVKRQHKKQMEILTEMMLQPRAYKTAKECPKVARLPWEIKSDHVHIDREFLLGEGTISNVYLGKLKGKAPILQWIGRVEMKQYQDCPVAVRVPRHFDEPEEDQLFREITSMRRLRHHDHIALFLGWTNKNDLEKLDNLYVLLITLTTSVHMMRAKFSVSDGDATSTAYIPYQMLFKIIWEICDGISYIHSRNLIHRDLAARNVLLTTGLRAKISGFGFCSDPDDPKFSGNSLAVRYLPVRWLAPECFQGKFSQKSDTWSFGVLLYETFTLGEVPYDDLQKPEEIVECVLHSRIPAHPKYASRQT